MSWTLVADVAAALCMLAGCTLALVAAIGLLRMPDLLSRMHPATKPQVLGLLLVLTGVALRLRTPEAVGFLLLVGLFQMVTSPVASHMLGRASYRAGQVDRDRLLVDELGEDGPGIDEHRGAP